MIVIDDAGFLWTNDMKLPVRLVGEQLEFCDKDKARSEQRGTRFVRIELTELLHLQEKRAKINK
jgi:hypothetical protein